MESIVPATVNPMDNITRIEYQGQFVLTTAQLAEFYECSQQQIRQNFANNSDRFVEEKHMFTLRGLELRNFKRDLEKNYPVGTLVDNFSSAPVLRLWTKRGAAHHAKMLSTDRAWEVFEMLEDAYFARPARQKSQRAIALELQRIRELRRFAAIVDDPLERDRLLDEATRLLKGQFQM